MHAVGALDGVRPSTNTRSERRNSLVVRHLPISAPEAQTCAGAQVPKVTASLTPQALGRRVGSGGQDGMRRGIRLVRY